MRTVQEAWPAREDRCPPTKSNADKVKKRPRTLDVPLCGICSQRNLLGSMH